jgi:hypothetical protein
MTRLTTFTARGALLALLLAGGGCGGATSAADGASGGDATPADAAAVADDGAPDVATNDGGPDGSASDAAVPPIPWAVWTRLDSGGGPFGAYFYRSVVLGNGDIWMAWGQPEEGNGRGNARFRAATNEWTLTNTVNDDPTRNIGARENYGAWFDADRDCIWIGDGAPVAYGFPNGPQCGDLKYDVASDTFALAFPNYGASPTAIGKGDGVLVYLDDVLYSFGGWSIGAGQSLARHHLVTGTIDRGLAAASTPSFTQPGARLTYARGGVDTRSGQLWTLADDGELYTLDVAQAPLAWVHRPTTGQKPGAGNYGAALHEARDALVAYQGNTGMVRADNGTPVGDTWVLDLSTWEWRFGPRAALGDPVPLQAELCVTVMNYDPANERIVVTVSFGPGTEVWALDP